MHTKSLNLSSSTSQKIFCKQSANSRNVMELCVEEIATESIVQGHARTQCVIIWDILLRTNEKCAVSGNKIFSCFIAEIISTGQSNMHLLIPKAVHMYFMTIMETTFFPLQRCVITMTSTKQYLKNAWITDGH